MDGNCLPFQVSLPSTTDTNTEKQDKSNYNKYEIAIQGNNSNCHEVANRQKPIGTMNKAYSDSLDRVKKGLQSNVFNFIDDQINDVGIDEALQNCNGNVSKAIIYYAGHYIVNQSYRT